MSLHSTNLDIIEILVKQNYKKVYQAVFALTKDKYISEDAVQQAFVIAYKKLDQLNSKDKFCSWVISIALNEAKRMLIRKNSDKITSITDYHLSTLSYEESGDIELREDINDVLNKLKQKDTEILILKYYADLTLVQISNLLGIKLSNAKVRLHRAKEEFRKLVDSDYNQNIGG